MQRIGRVRRKDHVTRGCDRLGKVGKPLLGAERDDHFAVLVERDVEAPLVVLHQRTAQARDPARGRIAVRIRLGRRLCQLGDHVRRGRHVGIAHAKVDDVGPRGAQFGLAPVDLLENVRRKPPDLVKFTAHVRSPYKCGLETKDGRAASGKSP